MTGSGEGALEARWALTAYNGEKRKRDNMPHPSLPNQNYLGTAIE